MASNSSCLGPRFYDYLNGLREEFELQSNPTSAKGTRPRRFNIYLEGLKFEFELLTEDIESLQKERDDFEVRVKEQAMEIQNIRNDVVCQGCSRGTVIPVDQPQKSLQIQNTSSSSHVVNLSQQRMTALGSSQSAIISPLSDFDTTSESIVVHPKSTTLPSPSPQTSINPNPDPEGIGKELNVEMTHAISHSGSIWSVKFSQDGKYLAAGCHNGRTYIYDVQSGSLICVLRNLLVERDLIGAVCFSRDGKYLATGSGYEGISIWEINTKYVRNVFKAGSNSIRSLDFSPNGRFLVSTSAYNSVCIWSTRDGATKDLTDDTHKVIYPYYTSAAFSPDGWHVAASHLDGMVRMWNVRTGQLMRRVTADMGTTFSIGFMPDGEGLMSGGLDNSLKYWDCSSWNSTSGSRTNDLDGRVSAQTRPEREYSGHNSSVHCVAISPDGRWVASGSLDRTVRIWDARTGTIQHSLKHDNWVYSVYFSPAGDHLASGGYDGMVKVWRYSHVPSGVDVLS